MKKVLLITYTFPPKHGLGGLRIKGIADYLNEHGWEPVILTSDLPGKPGTEYAVYQARHSDFVTQVKSRRNPPENRQVLSSGRAGTRRSDLSKLVLPACYRIYSELTAYPDEYRAWYKNTVAVGNEIIRDEKISAILSSSKPETCHLIAHRLKSDNNIPWVADLRDLWTQNHYYPYSPARKLLDRRMELKLFSKADALVTVSDYLSDRLRELHPNKPVYTITNGFNPAEMQHEPVPLSKKFTVTYTGSLYQGKRDPANLFRAVDELIHERKINRDDVEIRFFGENDEWLLNEISKYGLQDTVTLFGKVPRAQALSSQRESQVLLLLLWNHPDEFGVYTSKIFEYLAAKRPILAVDGPGGAVKELIGYTGAGDYAVTVETIKSAVERYYGEYAETGSVVFRGNMDRMNEYSSKEVSRKFASVLSDICQQTARSSQSN